MSTKTKQQESLLLKSVGQNLIVVLSNKAKELLKENVSQYTKTEANKEVRQNLKKDIAILIDKFENAKTDNGKIQHIRKLQKLFVTEEIENKKIEEVKEKAKAKKVKKEVKKENINKKQALAALESEDLSKDDIKKLEKLLAKFKQIEKTNVSVSTNKRGGEY